MKSFTNTFTPITTTTNNNNKSKKRKHDDAIIESFVGPRVQKFTRSDEEAKEKAKARTLQLLMRNTSRLHNDNIVPDSNNTQSIQYTNTFSSSFRYLIQSNISYHQSTHQDITISKCSGCDKTLLQYQSDLTNCKRCGDIVCNLCAIKTYENTDYDDSVICLQCYR